MKEKSLKVLITGGAGFIGSNLANRLLREGAHVTIYDNLSRAGAATNLAWLREQWSDECLRLVQGDLQQYDKLAASIDGVDRVYHLAGQVAVTTSVKNPRLDFQSNALGTFNALEATRQSTSNPIFLYTSTNKVYGGMDDLAISEYETRYGYTDLGTGVSELQPVDFHSPYGCSKGAGDQYVRDYARIYGLRTIVMRQSCIYGYRQFGVEDQGWIAWFIIAVLKGKPIHIYGDGKQVRDVLFIDDLLDAYEMAISAIDITGGQVYNMGGGPNHTVSIWREFGRILERLCGHPISVQYGEWRPGDQRVYISDISKAQADFGWSPKIGVEEGISRLFKWLHDNRHLFADLS